jgi:enamine deaminase RidA (YjgF/YER057c/UK114 family)
VASQNIEYIVPPDSKAFCDSIRYAEGVKVGNMLYLAGQVGWNPATGKIVEGGLREQVRGAFSNMKKR